MVGIASKIPTRIRADSSTTTAPEPDREVAIALVSRLLDVETMTLRAEKPDIATARMDLRGVPRSTEHFCTKV